MYEFIVKFIRFISLIFLLSCVQAADKELKISDIQIKGLHRIQQQQVIKLLPVKVGQRPTANQLSQVIRDLYQSGFFSDVKVAKQGQTLIITVEELPTIQKIAISGSTVIGHDLIKEKLKEQGITIGSLLQPSTLAEIKSGIEASYEDQGYSHVDVSVEQELHGQQANLSVEIDAGDPNIVQSIQLSGNKAFSSWRVMQNLDMKTTLFSWFTHNNYYSQSAMDRDLANLKSFYLNHGFLDFKIKKSEIKTIEGHQKKWILVLDEGQPYRWQETLIETVDEYAFVKPLAQTVVVGDYFDQRQLSALTQRVQSKITHAGYAPARITNKMIKKNQGVIVSLKVQPGAPVMVRYIRFKGNKVTQDRVLRREFLQLESSLYNPQFVKESERRVNNLGYIKDANCLPAPVGNRSDVIDLNCSVTETSSLIANASIGYSTQDGMLGQIGIKQSNFAGGGNMVSVSAERSALTKQLNFSVETPYITPNGVSRTVSLFYMKNKPQKDKSNSRYKTNSFGGLTSYNLPITTYDSWNIGFGASKIKLIDYDKDDADIKDFISHHGGHDDYKEYKLLLGWQRSTFNQSIFPSQGVKQSIDATWSLPIGGDASIQYYMLHAGWNAFYPITKGWVFNTKFQASYGNGYGDDPVLPFFKNLYAGGIGTVRGFQSNQLGPRTSDASDRATGGNILLAGNFNIYLPQTYREDMRFGLFVDVGNVFDRSIKWSQMAYSAGISAVWYSPFAPIGLAIGFPLTKQGRKYKELVGFSLSTEI
jgi:outer membrane protein insertion porin family